MMKAEEEAGYKGEALPYAVHRKPSAVATTGRIVGERACLCNEF